MSELRSRSGPSQGRAGNPRGERSDAATAPSPTPRTWGPLTQCFPSDVVTSSVWLGSVTNVVTRAEQCSVARSHRDERLPVPGLFHHARAGTRRHGQRGWRALDKAATGRRPGGTEQRCLGPHARRPDPRQAPHLSRRARDKGGTGVPVRMPAATAVVGTPQFCRDEAVVQRIREGARHRRCADRVEHHAASRCRQGSPAADSSSVPPRLRPAVPS